MARQKELALVIGVLGVLSTLFAAVGKKFNYQSKSDMHRDASMTLSGMKRGFDIKRSKMKLAGLDKKGSEEKRKRVKIINEQIEDQDLGVYRKELTSLREMLDLMEKVCTDPIPNKILQAFTDLEEIFKLVPFETRCKIYRRYYNVLFMKFSNIGRWRCCYPVIDPTSVFRSELEEDIEAMFENEAERPPTPKSGMLILEA